MRRFSGRKGMLSEHYTFDITHRGNNIYEFCIWNLPTQGNYVYIVHDINWGVLNYKFKEVV